MTDVDSYGAKVWEDKYKHGETSGLGSYGAGALFKARVINDFLKHHDIRSVIEFGCGDGNQLSLIAYPEYLGFDTSPTIIERCSNMFKGMASRKFRLISMYAGETADLALSLDVIYHIIEQEVYETYLKRLFAAALKYVIIYSTDTDVNPAGHELCMLHHKFSDWILMYQPEWCQIAYIKNECPYATDFYIYEHR